MPFSSNPRGCYACDELQEELDKLRSMVRAIEQLPTKFGLDEEIWINKKDLTKILKSKRYK